MFGNKFLEPLEFKEHLYKNKENLILTDTIYTQYEDNYFVSSIYTEGFGYIKFNILLYQDYKDSLFREILNLKTVCKYVYQKYDGQNMIYTSELGDTIVLINLDLVNTKNYSDYRNYYRNYIKGDSLYKFKQKNKK